MTDYQDEQSTQHTPLENENQIIVNERRVTRIEAAIDSVRGVCSDRRASYQREQDKRDKHDQVVLEKLDTWVPKRTMWVVAVLSSLTTVFGTQLLAHVLGERDPVVKTIGIVWSLVVG